MSKNTQNSNIKAHVTIADIERISGVNRSTLYLWRESRPVLYHVLEFAVRATRARELMND